jgi:RNA polymerase sigma-70 factor (ECF subfamily)
MPETTDRSLVIRALNGETEAFGALVRRYQSSVFNVCYRLLGERHTAEDQTQEAFIRAYQRLDTFDVDREFGPWIRRVAANLCYNHLKKSRVPEIALEEETHFPTAFETSGPEDALRAKERSAQIRRALSTLPDHYRVVVEFRHFQAMNYEEIAAELELPLNTVKSHLFRARKHLARILSEGNYG